MAAAVAARRLSSSLAASARSTPTGASAPTIRFTTRPFFKRPYSSKHQPDPTKMKEVAENLVKVLKETPSEATRSQAESLVNQLKGFYPPPVEGCRHFSAGARVPGDKAKSGLLMLWQRARNYVEDANLEERGRYLFVYALVVVGTPSLVCFKRVGDIKAF